MDKSDSLERGIAFAQKVYGAFTNTSPGAMSLPAEIRDDAYDWGMSAIFGDIWSRTGLDTKTRLLITIALLGALNRREGLREHVYTALKNDISRQEICETLFHIAFLSGLPSSLESLRLTKTVFDEIDAQAAAAK